MTDVRAADVSIVAAESDLIESAAAPRAAISWGAVIAGGFANGALTLLLIAFGAGMGFSAVSPWASSGVSSTTFSIGTGIYFIVIAMLASTVGGYLAGRLCTRSIGVHADEAYFRDTAHGFISWAVAIVVSAAALGTAGTALVSGVSAGLAQRSSADASPVAIYVDELFRPAPTNDTAAATAATAPAPATAPGGTAATAPAPAPTTAATTASAATAADRAEVSRLLLRSLRDKSDLSASDRAYVAQLVSARTGLSKADADKRVTDVLTQAKSDLDKARSGAAKLALWFTAALFAGALAASLAAIEGGQVRDRAAL
ncbi:MAG TPA: hypothetical protein VKX28_18480 [Xanthobacteraceae bacterium]|nr:hypothetical protein [Xanthobacteraceae bacterium]